MGCGWALLVGMFVVGGFHGRRLRVLVVRGIRCWWGLVMGAHPCLCCLGVCLRLPLAGDGGGCLCSPSPSFVLPGCAFPFAIGGGCLPPLVSPHWVLVSAVCGDGGGCSCSPSPSFMSPHCALPLVVGAWTHLCGLVGCSCLPLVGDGGGCLPPFVPLVGCSPLFMWPVACHHCCVSSWLCLLVGFVRCVWDERAYHWLKDGC